MTDRPKTPVQFITNPTYQGLLVTIDRHRALLKLVREKLPPELGAHCLDCVPRLNRLTIYVDSAAWGYQLRFHSPKILSHLNQMSGNIFSEVRVKTTTAFNLASASEIAQATTRHQQVKHLERGGDCRDNTLGDPLAAALIKLTNTLDLTRSKAKTTDSLADN